MESVMVGRSFRVVFYLTKNSQEFVDAKNHVFQHGIEAVHFANGYDGLKEMIEQYGEDYAPTMPEPSAPHQVSTCHAAVSQTANEESAEEQEGIEDPSPTVAAQQLAL